MHNSNLDRLEFKVQVQDCIKCLNNIRIQTDWNLKCDFDITVQGVGNHSNLDRLEFKGMYQ